MRNQPGLLRGEWHHQTEGKDTKTLNRVQRQPGEGHHLAAAKERSTRGTEKRTETQTVSIEREEQIKSTPGEH